MAMGRVNAEVVAHGVMSNDSEEGFDMLGMLDLELRLVLKVGKIVVPAIGDAQVSTRSGV